MTEALTRSASRVRGFDNPEFDFQLLRSLGATAVGAGAIGECLSVASRTRDAEPSDWVAGFSALAERVATEAVRCRDAGRSVSARDLFARAGMYFRAAEYFEDMDSPDHDRLGLASRDAFHAYARLCEPPIEPIEIPFEPRPLPAYFAKPGIGEEPRKTAVVVGGFDSSGEELFFQCGVEALKRGYNVLVFDGPGQTGTMRLTREMPFRPDYEAAIRPAIDYALSRPEVDSERLGLVGISFGGYFCLRGAAFDERIRALVPNSPIVDLSAYMRTFFGGDLADEEDMDLETLAAQPDEVVPSLQRQMGVHLLRKFGVETTHALSARLKEFRADDDLMGRIACPSLACIGEGEGPEPMRQTERFCRATGGPVTKQVFTLDWGADSHCQLNNLARSGQVTFDWMDEVFAGAGRH